MLSGKSFENLKKENKMVKSAFLKNQVFAECL